MPLKDILIHVDDGRNCDVRLGVASQLARRHDAHLVGLFVRTRPYVPPYLRVEFGAEVMAMQDSHLAEAERAAEARFRQSVGDRPSEWRGDDGDAVERLSLHARYADLTIVGQRAPAGEDVDEGLAVDQLVVDAAGPVLVVPFAGRFDSVGERVLVCWNGSREATRAIAGAMPLLERASRVEVLVVNPGAGPDTHGDVPGADIGLHLARHGVPVEVQTMRADDVDIGNLILSRAADANADLIVMGAYGRSRLREMVLGGATRHILQHMTVPTLMAH